MSLTAEQVLQLAPDASSRKAGQDQAKAAKWSGLGSAGEVIWGEIKGSGASPYRTVADLSGPASKCTCPSRKFPCKHALGLMLVHAAGSGGFGAIEPPDWVAAWTKGRASRGAGTEARAEAATKPVDEKAQARRRQAREDKVEAALDELDLWLRDLMRRGLSSLRGEPYAFFDRMAGRLVDGQAPGLARRVRALPALIAAAPRDGSGPVDEALALALGRLGLVVRAARRLDVLDAEQAASVRAVIGYPVTTEELAAREGHTDSWAVIAQQIEEEDKLTARSVWLVGRTHGRVAQVLDYGTAGSPLPPAPVTGQDFSGEIAFYPGAPPLRAAFREGRASTPADAALPGAVPVGEALDEWAAALAVSPWTETWPLRLRNVAFGILSGSGTTHAYGIGDASGSLPLARDHRTRAFAAVAGGRPVDLFGIYDGHGLTPLSIIAEGHLYAAPAQEPRPLLRRVA